MRPYAIGVFFRKPGVLPMWRKQRMPVRYLSTGSNVRWGYGKAVCS